jgi:hypothetical protein
MENGMENKFKALDQVKVDGYEDEVFKVVEINPVVDEYIAGFMYTGIMYKVMNIKTNKIANAFESDLTLLHRYDNEYSRDRRPRHIKKWELYEKHLELYRVIGDESYQDEAVRIYDELIQERKESGDYKVENNDELLY